MRYGEDPEKTPTGERSRGSHSRGVVSGIFKEDVSTLKGRGLESKRVSLDRKVDRPKVDIGPDTSGGLG